MAWSHSICKQCGRDFLQPRSGKYAASYCSRGCVNRSRSKIPNVGVCICYKCKVPTFDVHLITKRKCKDGIFSHRYVCNPCNTNRLRAWRGKDGNMQKVYRLTKKYALNNPKRVRAYSLVQNALSNGNLTKQGCEFCGSTKTHAHHDDYGAPLDVRWLCPKHHKEVHRLLHA